MKKWAVAIILAVILFCAGIYIVVKLPVHVKTTKTTKAAKTHTIERYALTYPKHEITLVKANAPTQNVVIFLHGFGGNDQSFVTRRLLNELGKTAYQNTSLAFPSSSAQSFWHNRSSGKDAGDWEDYVINKVIPDVKNRITNQNPKIIIAGVSMGGFGALHIAEQHPDLFCGVAGHSAAIWTSAEKTAAGSFDSKEDFETTDVIKNSAKLKSMPVWLDNGTKDWFLEGATAFESAAKAHAIPLEKHIWTGGHDGIYWDAHWPDYLGFYNKVFVGCTT
jgi:S-formylglutathione hydrolase FrmB